MGKEQRSEKMKKKPKKAGDTGADGPVKSDRPSPPITTIMPRGKEKKK